MISYNILRKTFIKGRMYSRLRELIRLILYTFRKKSFIIIPFIYLVTFLIISNYLCFSLILPALILIEKSLPSRSNSKPRCAAIVRVSTEKQAKEGNSIPFQIEKIKEYVSRKGYELIKIIIEDGQSGRSLERDGIWDVIGLAREGKIDYLLVIDIDRVGRNAISNLIFAGILFILGVKIINVIKNEEYDLNSLKDLILLVLDSINSQEELRKLKMRMINGKLTKFKSKKWVKSTIDFGYVKDGGWVKKDKSKEKIVKDIFLMFLRRKSYAAVNREIFRKYNLNLGISRIKTILKNPIYIGKPKFGEAQVEDDNLAMIDKRVFDKVQTIIGSESKKRPKSNNDKKFVEKLIEELGIFNVKRLIPEVAYVCRDCHVPLVKDGTKNINGKEVQRYMCPSCGKQAIDPVWKYRNKLRNVIYFICECFSLENYYAEKLPNGNYLIICKNCGQSFETSEPSDPYLRYIREKQRKSGKLSGRAFIFKNKKNQQRTLDGYLSSNHKAQ